MSSKDSTLYLLGQISTFYKVHLDKKMKEINLHGGQIFVLLCLFKNDGLSQIQLANELNLSAPTVHKMIKSLSESDFLYSSQSLEDSRQIRVFLTQKGIDIKESIFQKLREFEDQIIKDFTETEKLILQQLCRKLVNNLSNLGK
jgi:DNA-binding MarR family transcriptional regulator